jgi:hypothetical protein
MGSIHRIARFGLAFVIATDLACSPAAPRPDDGHHAPKNMLEMTEWCYHVDCVGGKVQLRLDGIRSTPSSDAGVNFRITRSDDKSTYDITQDDLILADRAVPIPIPLSLDCVMRGYNIHVTTHADGRTFTADIPYECKPK